MGYNEYLKDNGRVKQRNVELPKKINSSECIGTRKLRR